MSKVMVTEGKLVRIADAIRTVAGSEDEYTLDEMPEVIVENSIAESVGMSVVVPIENLT